MGRKKIEVVNMSLMTLLPPNPNVCQQCGSEMHTDPEQPHNQQSMYWQYWFHGKHERWPTWKDAMAHCSEKVKALWIEGLAQQGVIV